MGKGPLVSRGDLWVQDDHAEPGRSQIQISLAGVRTRRLSAATRSSLGCGGRRSRALAGVPLTPPCAARLFLPRGPISGWQRLSRERARWARPSRAAGPSPRVLRSWSVRWRGAPKPQDAVSDKLGSPGGHAAWESEEASAANAPSTRHPERPERRKPADPGPARGGGPGGALSPAGSGGGGEGRRRGRRMRRRAFVSAGPLHMEMTPARVPSRVLWKDACPDRRRGLLGVAALAGP